ncbi:MAG: hypothetical protein DIU68_019295 [Chloroflexota bacterium]|nr:MAG: hypothetical protein DIU68_14825 [Chloroflexota bacterium]
MNTLFTVLVVGVALSAVVAMMYVVMREKRDEEAELRYRRSPWDDLETTSESAAGTEEATVEANAGEKAETGAPAADEPAVEEPPVEAPVEENRPE